MSVVAATARRLATGCLYLVGLAAAPARADTNPFDLAGPSLRATVTRNGVTLPLSQVPDLAAGDRLRIEAELPSDQTARYHLVLTFLRGATNPPPRKWLIDAETWRPAKARIDAVVPAGAEQALVLFVPDTGGALSAVGSALRDRPGAFVRASQELNQAMLDRARLDAFLRGVRERDAADPARIAEVSPRLAQSLAVKLDADCLLRQPQTQAACLTQGSNAVVLADSQTNSIAQTLAGAPADIALQLSATPQGGYGYYSPYIGVVRDLARILGAFQSAQLQFIPALSVQQGPRTRLLLNAVPSFRKPQSVLVAALPNVGDPTPPPLRSRAEGVLCVARPDLSLPVGGAPLLFATGYARDLSLALRRADGRLLEAPLSSDPARGGLIVTSPIDPSGLGPALEGVVHGSWGFTPFAGPRYRLAAPQGAWRIADGGTLVVGREAPLTLEGGTGACVSEVTVRTATAELPVAWSVREDGRLSLKAPLIGAAAGPATLVVRSHGVAEPQRIGTRAYAEASGISGFVIHAGDRQGVLTGGRLDQVAALKMGGATFHPVSLERTGSGDRLTMGTDDEGVGRLHPGDTSQARVALADGRTIARTVVVAAGRPKVELIEQTVDAATPSGPMPVVIRDPTTMAQSARLTFSLKASGEAEFVAGDAVEASIADGSVAVLPLRLQDGAVAIATLQPVASFGPDAHGRVRFRIVRNGVAGDWQSLVTVARVPTLTGLRCEAADRCTLAGKDLFLLAGVSDGDPSRGLPVPQGFTGMSIIVPRPVDGRLTLVLRDAPDAVATVAAERGHAR